MKQQTETPLYATLLYDVRKKLDITWNEYVYLDMVQKLHIRQAYCTKSLDNCAADIGITRRGLIKIKNKLLERGLLEKNLRGHVRVTIKYTEVAVNKVHQPGNLGVNKVPKVVNKVHSASEKSSLIKNNNRNTKNKGSEKMGQGYKKAQLIRSRLATRLSA